MKGMNCKLLHKDDVVASLLINEDNGIITDRKVIAPELVPKYIDSKKAMQEWWSMRAIPKSRGKVAEVLLKNGISSTLLPMFRNFGLSLSDCYWIKPDGMDAKWKDVNFHQNDFSKLSFSSLLSPEIINRLKDRKFSSKNLSPYFSLNGQMSKYWEIRNKQRILVKEATDVMSRQQCLNEIMGTMVHRNLNKFPYLEYTLIFGNDNAISGVSCPCFTSENIEYVPMMDLIPSGQIDGNKSGNELKDILLSNLEKTGADISMCESFIAYNYLTDFLISNTDRHLNNFGILRNADTMKFVSFAPVFDSGNSMLFRGADGYFSPDFRKFKSRICGIYSNDEKIITGCKKHLEDIDLSLLPSPDEIYHLYKDNLFYYTTQNAEFIARAYNYKVQTFKLVRENVPLYNISSGKVHIPEWVFDAGSDENRNP